MPTPTYTALANITLGSSASYVTLSSIPATYRDLVLVYSGSGTAPTEVWATLNGSTANGSTVVMLGTGSAAQSGTSAAITIGTIDTTICNNIVQFMDYSATDKHKTILTRSNRAGAGTLAYATRWAITSAITSIAVVPQSGTFNSGHTFALYGIAS